MRKLILFLLVGMAFGQNARYDDIALGPKGSIPFASVAVCSPQPANTVQTPCTPLAPLCSSLTDAICNSPNPLLADFLGNYHFYLKNSAIPFTVQIYGPQVAAPFVMVDQGVTGNGGGVIGTCTANTFTGWITALTVGCAPATFAGNNSLFAGSVSTASDGVHAGSIQLLGNTTLPNLNPSSVALFGPNSSSFSAYSLQWPATAPLQGQVPIFGTPAGTNIPITFGLIGDNDGLAPQYVKLRCESGLGDGLNAMPAGTYLQAFCYNDSGVTWTITGILCFTDNNGTSTLNASGHTLGALLTGAITCTNSFAAGTQSANVALTSGDWINFTFVGDGANKQTTWVVSMKQ